jgi:AraC family transcriptional regulator of adaptative response/methylated-DNA-[protein]-cysteine methyltransferase
MKACLPVVRYTTVQTRSFGTVAVGATIDGVRAVVPLEPGASADKALRAELHDVQLVEDSATTDALARDVARAIDGDGDGAEIPLDLSGTLFQQHVWKELRLIPFGATISYSELAARIGRPDAVRAVANACGGNHVAVLVPCHRVIRADGTLGGYKWDLERKRALLEAEATSAG